MAEDYDKTLLGRLGGSLDEQGRALKTIQGGQIVLQAKSATHDTQIDSAHARLKSLEHSIHGNGSDGLRTEMRLVQESQKRLSEDFSKSQDGLQKSISSGHARLEALMTAVRDDLETEIDTISKWKNGLGDIKIRGLESEKKESKDRKWAMLVFILTFSLASASFIGSCGPKIIQSWSQTPAENKTSLQR